MTFTITNTYYKLVIRLKTNLTTIPTLTYKHIERQYVTNLPLTTYTTETVTNATLADGIITYNIPFKNYEVGDVLTDFTCTLSGTSNIYDLEDGVTILVDGEESDVIKVENGNVVLDSDNQYIKVNPLSSSQFALVFEDNDVHTVQAIFKGNSTMGVALSEKAVIAPIVKEDESELEGTYKIEFTKFEPSMKYMGDVDWEIKLTKGNIGVPNALIQLDTPTGSYTSTTDDNGITTFKRNKTTIQNNSSQLAQMRAWNAGTYKIQARYHYYDETEQAFKELICKTIKNLKITKGTPSMSVAQYAQTRKGSAIFKLKDPLGFNLENTKLVEVVNGRTYNKSTNAHGNVVFKVGVKGTVKYKLKFTGNKNLNAKTWTFSEVIT